jgi:hypothetical protein
VSTPADAATEPEPSPSNVGQEVEVLRARVAALEQELVEVTARANAAVAAAQDRAYWLDRWHLDLNALMARPGAAQFRAALRAVRSVVWFLKRLSRRLRG